MGLLKEKSQKCGDEQQPGAGTFNLGTINLSDLRGNYSKKHACVAQPAFAKKSLASLSVLFALIQGRSFCCFPPRDL